MLKFSNSKKGFTLVEIIVSVAIFAVLSLSVYGIYTAILKGIVSYRERITISALADHYMEIARNLPYSKIGTLSGNPHGSLPDLPNKLSVTFNSATYQVYYVVNIVDDPADGTALLETDSAPNDYKQIKLYIKNANTQSINSFLTNVSSGGLENASNQGAIFIEVFNAVGQPVPNATINIKNTNISPGIDLTRLSDASGKWVEVGLPISANNYHITVTKNGYSFDQTYPASTQNPDPIKSDATVADGQVTKISFSIDLLSNLTLKTFNQTCQPMSGVELGLRGSKLIGIPSVFKFENNYTSNSSGLISLNNIEWDNYTPALITQNYMIYGSSPIQQVSLMPGTNQNFTLILGPKTQNSLLAIVKDASTGNSIEGVNLTLQKSATGFSQSKITGGSVQSQQDWSSGSGQQDFTDPKKYFEDDGNITTDQIPLGVRLAKTGGNYVSSGYLISSTFDTGTDASTYTTLTWQPPSQDPACSIKFQIAANNDQETWNFAGPDGTANTFYTVPGTTIKFQDAKRYVRYKAILSTQDPLKTPVLTSVSINYVSGCSSPGQSIFTGLDGGSGYSLTAEMQGYQSQTIEGLEINGYNVLEILLNSDAL